MQFTFRSENLDTPPEATAAPVGSDHYEPAYCAVAKTVYQLGGTAADVAEALEIDLPRLLSWEGEHEEFKSACKEGRADAQGSPQQSAFRRCTGYAREIEKVVVRRDRAFVEKHYEHVKADFTSCKFWLINRRPEKWKKTGEGGRTMADLARSIQDIIEGNSETTRAHEGKE